MVDIEKRRVIKLDENKFEMYFKVTKELDEYHSNKELMSDLYSGTKLLLDSWMENINADMSQLYVQIFEYINVRIDETKPFRNLNLVYLAQNFGLLEPQVFMLALSGLCRYNGKYCDIYSKLQQDKRSTYLTKSLAFLLCHNIWGEENYELDLVIGNEEFLRLFFEKNNEFTDDMVGLKAPLRIREDIYDFMFGNTDSLLDSESIIEFFGGKNKIGTIKGRDKEIERISLLAKEPLSIAVTGEKHSGRKFLIKHSALINHKAVIFVNFSVIRKNEKYKAEAERLYFVSRLLNAWLCLVEFDIGDEEDLDILHCFTRYAAKFGITFFMTCNYFYGARLISDSMWVNIELHEPDALEALKLWQVFIDEYDYDIEGIGDLDISELAGKYKLYAGDIRHALESASYIARSMGRNRINSSDIAMAVKQHNGKALGKYAQLLDNRITRDELVVNADTAKQLEYIENRLKYKNLVDGVWGFGEKVSYGKGVCALFYGPPGTGKTMAARVLASELGLELYRVDLSRMVSKYIGETQKNISELFDRAKGVNALLFFDEADALFAKRTEVSDSKDRNANSEVAHLLQKLEEYEGISILATNLKDNIDDAFKRRIKYMVYFASPDKMTRTLLWKKMLPQKAPVEEGLDLEFFAENFEMSGSEIKDAMLHAAYMAAGEQSPIGNRHIMEAVRLSFAKYGKVLKKEDFGYLGI